MLIDPTTGLMTQMRRQSDEGQYVPVAGQLLEGLKAQQQQPTGPHPFVPVQQPQQANKPKGTELERAGALERAQPDPAPYSIQIQKNEGLPALLAQQQQQQLIMQQQQQQKQIHEQQQFEVRRK
jgi:hypothetical protein